MDAGVTNEVGASAEFASARGAFKRRLFGRGGRRGGGRGHGFFGVGVVGGSGWLGDRWLDVAHHKRVGRGGRVDGYGVHHHSLSGLWVVGSGGGE